MLSWSFTTIAVAAKNVMSSVPDYLLIESGYTVVQWIIVAPLMAPSISGAMNFENPRGSPRDALDLAGHCKQRSPGRALLTLRRQRSAA